MFCLPSAWVLKEALAHSSGCIMQSWSAPCLISVAVLCSLKEVLVPPTLPHFSGSRSEWAIHIIQEIYIQRIQWWEDTFAWSRAAVLNSEVHLLASKVSMRYRQMHRHVKQ